MHLEWQRLETSDLSEPAREQGEAARASACPSLRAGAWPPHADLGAMRGLATIKHTRPTVPAPPHGQATVALQNNRPRTRPKAARASACPSLRTGAWQPPRRPRSDEGLGPIKRTAQPQQRRATGRLAVRLSRCAEHARSIGVPARRCSLRTRGKQPGPQVTRRRAAGGRRGADRLGRLRPHWQRHQRPH